MKGNVIESIQNTTHVFSYSRVNRNEEKHEQLIPNAMRTAMNFQTQPRKQTAMSENAISAISEWSLAPFPLAQHHTLL